ncbi:bactofilin family protein [Clostridium niameyense]|uniref:bactofilin family protein n=1 Tax=Clostridium niameyense TaxID=1622073 RepID=UPI00067EFA2E|nr:polymer-forming cytoskeletal protein [Clostridium niameyense]
MFKNKKSLVENKLDTVIGSDTSIEGDINSSETIKIDGKLIGDIEGKSQVIIGELGLVQGNINAKDITISGKVEGNIICNNLIQIKSSGKVLGDIQTINLVVEDGGVVNGSCSMKVDDIKRIVGPNVCQL